MRNWGARVRDGARVAGYGALVLENSALRVTLLVDRGADVVEFLHKPTDTDFCTFSKRGLRGPAESAGRPFMDIYYGGWQEVFPSGGGGLRFPRRRSGPARGGRPVAVGHLGVAG